MPEALPKAPIIPVPNPTGWDETPVPAVTTEPIPMSAIPATARAVPRSPSPRPLTARFIARP